MLPLPNALVKDFSKLEALLGVAFSQRRKMLRANFIPWLLTQGVTDHGLEPTARAQEISVHAYARLADMLP
jgi:16S rRNA (adenine1518-N6/adenine1519-N6)-dimethyltransferase